MFSEEEEDSAKKHGAEEEEKEERKGLEKEKKVSPFLGPQQNKKEKHSFFTFCQEEAKKKILFSLFL